MPTESDSWCTGQDESQLQCCWLPVHRIVSCKLAIISNYLTECIIDLCITKLLLRYVVRWHIINLLNINQLHELVEDFTNYLLHNISLVSFSSHTLVIEAAHVIDRHTIWIDCMSCTHDLAQMTCSWYDYIVKMNKLSVTPGDDEKNNTNLCQCNTREGLYTWLSWHE